KNYCLFKQQWCVTGISTLAVLKTNIRSKNPDYNREGHTCHHVALRWCMLLRNGVCCFVWLYLALYGIVRRSLAACAPCCCPPGAPLVPPMKNYVSGYQ